MSENNDVIVWWGTNWIFFVSVGAPKNKKKARKVWPQQIHETPITSCFEVIKRQQPLQNQDWWLPPFTNPKCAKHAATCCRSGQGPANSKQSTLSHHQDWWLPPSQRGLATTRSSYIILILHGHLISSHRPSHSILTKLICFSIRLHKYSRIIRKCSHQHRDVFTSGIFNATILHKMPIFLATGVP